MYDKDMSKINILLANSSEEFNETKSEIINAISEVEEYTFTKLKIDWDIDLVVNNRMDFLVIPEDGVGGYTYASDFIVSALDFYKKYPHLSVRVGEA